MSHGIHHLYLMLMNLMKSNMTERDELVLEEAKKFKMMDRGYWEVMEWADSVLETEEARKELHYYMISENGREEKMAGMQ